MKRLFFTVCLLAFAALPFSSCKKDDPSHSQNSGGGPTPPPSAAYSAVDLGLSVKWASFNIGASAPEGYGNFYAWGETAPKDCYDHSNYAFGDVIEYTITKYNTKPGWGVVDSLLELEPADDAAHVLWGGSWRMPTLAEAQELVDDCSWSWTTLNGINGYRVTGPNGNSIFLPAAGGCDPFQPFMVGKVGRYWVNRLCSDLPDNACGIYFHDSLHVAEILGWRYFGSSIRPVCP